MHAKDENAGHWAPQVADDSGVVRQDEVSAALGGIPWRHCRQLLQVHGIEVLPDGKRRWLVRRADWLRFRDAFARREVAQ
jgi:hypothetical protein